MGSSASTPSRSERPIRIGIVVVGDDHPRACTGRRLLRRRLARSLAPGSARAGAGILLDPYAERPLSPADRPRAERLGLVAVDCSWNRLSEAYARGTPASTSRPRVRRRLPMLLAGNPQHFGRLGELNTAEALAAALAVWGREAEARRLLEGFAGGEAFLAINRRRIERYRSAGSAEEVLRAERELFGGAEASGGS